MSNGNEISWKMMMEQAKEELQVLESQYPDRFEYLKLELRSFIFLLQSHHYSLLSNSCSKSFPTSSTATTQASSSRKRKKEESEIQEIIERRVEACRRKLPRVEGEMRRRDRIEVVLERAQACLQKIQHLKTSFYSNAPNTLKNK